MDSHSNPHRKNNKESIMNTEERLQAIIRAYADLKGHIRANDISDEKLHDMVDTVEAMLMSSLDHIEKTQMEKRI